MAVDAARNFAAAACIGVAMDWRTQSRGGIVECTG